MKFKRYITEKRAELTGDQWKDKFIKQLNQWDKDISQMTKLYKSLKPTQDDLKNFKKAEKAFIIFGQNFEKWIYEDLLDKKIFGKETESGFTKDVRVKAWDTRHFLNAGNLFPSAWNYKTDKHEPAPEELDSHDGGRKNKILRWQRSWRKTKEAIVDLIQYQAETLKERQPDEQVQIAGVNILIKNKGDEWTEKYFKRFVKALPKAIAQIKKQGMAKSIKDFKIQINFRPETVEGLPNGGGLTAGAYDKNTDILYIFPLGLNDNLSDSTLIHEIGHRYWFKYVPDKAKRAWKDKIEKRMVQVETEHIEKFFDMFWDKEWGFPYRRDFPKKLEGITDPTLKIIFRYLSEHTPIFDVKDGRDEKTVYKEHMIRHHRGEQIPLEWITDYGRTNDAEAFAEAFKLWVGGVKGKLGEWTRAFFKEIVRTGGSSLKEDVDLVNKYMKLQELSMKKKTDIEYNKRRYSFIAHIRLHDGTYFQFLATFTDPSQDMWFIEFFDEKDQVNIQPKRKGAAIELFAALETVFDEFMKEHDPMIVTFSGLANEPSRVKLYDIITKKLAKKYEFKIKEKRKTLDQMSYTLRKEGAL